MKLNEEDEFYSLDYEDLILIMARVIKYYTKLNIYMDFTFLEKKVIMSVWGTERQLDNLAERMKYQLKLMVNVEDSYGHFINNSRVWSFQDQEFFLVKIKIGLHSASKLLQSEIM